MKKVFRAWWKKVLVSLVIAAVLAVGLEFIQVKTQPPYFEYRETALNRTETLKNEGAELSGCALEQGILQTGEGQAELAFTLPDPAGMNRVKILLDKPAEKNAYFRVYCTKAGTEEAPEVNAAEAFCLEGMAEMDFWVPRESYSKVLVKIDGSAAVREIRTEDAEGEKILIPGSMLKGRIVRVAALIFLISMLLWAVHGWTRIGNCFRAAKRGILEDPRKTAVNALIFLCAGGITWVGLRLYLPYLLGRPFNFVLNAFSLLAAAAAGCLFCFRKTLGKKPEVFFLVFCLLMGSVLTFFLPASLVSWDEETHAANALRFSYLGNARYTWQDEFTMTPGNSYDLTLSYFDGTIKEQDRLNQSGIAKWRSGMPGLRHFWYAFTGAGLFLGRALGLPYHWIWSMGRFFGLLSYATVGYFAIRRLKSGKMILSAVLLIPLNFFLASTFSYDAGVTSFLALGMSYLIREWQEPEEKIRWKNILIMLGALLAGCAPKEIYFPILLLPLFMRREKFTGKAQRRCYTGLTVLAMAILVLSFMIPFLTTAEYGDSRGGTTVSSGGQVGAILSDPLRYAEILFRFLRDYLNPDGFHQFATFFAYLGTAPYSNLCLILLAALAFTDRDGRDLDIPGKGWSRGAMLLILFGTLALAATSMYIAFTPVGLDTINGFQPRYLLPLFFPAIMLLFSGRVRNEVNRAVYNGAFFAAIGFVGFSAVLLKCAALYV